MVQREGSKRRRGKGSRDNSQRSKPQDLLKEMPQVRRDAAGIDLGSRSHWVAVPADRDAEPIREFSSLTEGLGKLADWLKSCAIKTVAMEATGVYWIPTFDLLEERGFEVHLINAKHLKNVPGRKSDVLDCQWIQQLHSFGLLRGSFRPTKEILELRAYVRQRDRLVRDAAEQVQYMQKALLEMNVQLHHMVSDLTGVTGMGIVRAIVAGERDGNKLAELRDPRCRESKASIAASLQGTYKSEHLFVLEQALKTYDLHQELLKSCDERIEGKLVELEALVKGPVEPCPPQRHDSPKKNQPKFEIQSPLHRICNNFDMTQIHGIAPATALHIAAEIGTDMSRWPTEKHFTSWLNLAPGTRITGGKLLSARRGPSTNRAGLALRQAAVATGRTDTALGSFYRRIASQRGAGKAAVATARKMAVLIYHGLKHGQAFVDRGIAAYEREHAERQIRSLNRRATAFGYQLTPVPTEASAAAN